MAGVKGRKQAYDAQDLLVAKLLRCILILQEAVYNANASAIPS